MPKSLFQRAVLDAHGDNDIHIHSVRFGDRVVTIVNYSPDWRVQTGNEPKVMETHPPRVVTRDDIIRLHKLADMVREFYGENCVGALPPIPRKRNRKKAA